MKRLIFALLALCFFQSTNARAHTEQVEPILITIRPQNAYLQVEMRGNGEDIIQAVRVQDSERIGSESFVPAVQERLQTYINDKLILAQGGQTLRGEIRALEYWRPDNMDYTKSNFRTVLRYERPTNLVDKPFTLRTQLFDYLPNARTIVSVAGAYQNPKAGETLTLDPSAVAANLWRNVRDFAGFGIQHIFTGPDHILFILALLVASTNFGSLVKTLSGFTLAHSITLCLAAIAPQFSPPGAWVELLVAASIVYVGLENLWGKTLDKRFWVASAFGLVHGFGFAGYLREEIGLPDTGLIWSLLSFNLGVELGQIAICAIAFPLVVMARRKLTENVKLGGSFGWPRAFKLASWFVVAAGGFWLLERVMVNFVA